MKKLFLSAVVLLLAASTFANTPTPKISEKALKAFKETFLDAQNVVWTEEASNYQVKFTQQGINTFVQYDPDGNFISSRRYYAGDKLPLDIQCTLKKKYADKTVFGVTELIVGEDVNYYVKMEDAKRWTTVRIDNARNMEVVEKYYKL